MLGWNERTLSVTSGSLTRMRVALQYEVWNRNTKLNWLRSEKSFQTKHCSSTKYADNKRVSEVLPNEYWSRISVTPFLGCIERHNDVIMDAMASKITSLTFVYSTVYPGADQRKHQSRASQAFGRGVHHRANAGQLLAHNVTQGYFYFVTLFTSSRWSDIYASVKQDTIVSNNGLPPVRWQTIIWIHDL